MGKSTQFLCLPLIVTIVFLSGCATTLPGELPATSEHTQILQGIEYAEWECVGDLGLGSLKDPCVIRSPEKEKIIDRTILKLKEKEQKCLTFLGKSESTLCVVTPQDKETIGKKIGLRYLSWWIKTVDTGNIENSVDKEVSNVKIPYHD
jgi:hypothetical protein